MTDLIESDPVEGDLVDALPALLAEAPADATKVVFHTSVLYQVPEARCREFVALVQQLPVHWISIEDTGTIDLPGVPAPPPDGLHHNVLALDGKPLAWTQSHGRTLHWFAD